MGAFLPVVFTAGWASGVNPYLFTLLTIILGRLNLIDVPEALERTDVLVVVLALTVIDTIVGKIAGLDSLWDAANTVVRPLSGGALSVLLSAPETTLGAALIAGSGGLLALITHLAKATIRVGVNTSPEPASNIVVSLLEDILVAGVVLLAVLNPYLAALIAAFLLLCMLVLAYLLKRSVTAMYRRVRRRGSRGADGAADDSAAEKKVDPPDPGSDTPRTGQT